MKKRSKATRRKPARDIEREAREWDVVLGQSLALVASAAFLAGVTRHRFETMSVDARGAFAKRYALSAFDTALVRAGLRRGLYRNWRAP